MNPRGDDDLLTMMESRNGSKPVEQAETERNGGAVNGSSNGYANGYSNGHSNGHSTNGYHTNGNHLESVDNDDVTLELEELEDSYETLIENGHA